MGGSAENRNYLPKIQSKKNLRKSVYEVRVIRVPILHERSSQEDRNTDDADFVHGFSQIFFGLHFGQIFPVFRAAPKSDYLPDNKIRENPCTKSVSSVFPSSASGPRRRMGTRMTRTLYTDFHGFCYREGAQSVF